MSAGPASPGYWRVLGLLLAASYRRALGRRRRQRALWRQRAPRRTDFGLLGFILGALALAALHVMTAVIVARAVAAGEVVAIEQGGGFAVDSWFSEAVAHPRPLHGAVARCSIRLRRWPAPFMSRRFTSRGVKAATRK